MSGPSGMVTDMVSLYLGPTRERWAPQNWQDVESAAVAGLLDEQRWVELKQAIPAANKGANRELAKDLAALACDGGLMIIGVEDKGDGRAGEVLGTPLTGLQDRISQVAGSALISPPLVVRTVPIAHPTIPDHGCLLVIVDASIDGPHMVDGSYRGRGDVGTRVLSDPEIRRYLVQNAQHREDFAQTFRNSRAQSPLGGPGVLHLIFRPRSGRRGALTPGLGHANVLLNDLTRDLPTGLWTLLQELRHTRRVVRGVLYTSFSEAEGVQAQLADRASEIEANLAVVRIGDDGTLLVSCSRLVYTTGDTASPASALSVAGVLSITEQVTVMAGRLADRAGYGGGWDIGMAMTGLKGCHAGIQGHRMLVGHYGAAFPDDAYEEQATTKTAELQDRPWVVPDRLLHELYRVLGAEQEIEKLRAVKPA